MFSVKPTSMPMTPELSPEVTFTLLMVPCTEALKRIPMAPGFFLPVRSVRSRMEFLCLGFGPSPV